MVTPAKKTTLSIGKPDQKKIRSMDDFVNSRDKETDDLPSQTPIIVAEGNKINNNVTQDGAALEGKSQTETKDEKLEGLIPGGKEQEQGDIKLEGSFASPQASLTTKPEAEKVETVKEPMTKFPLQMPAWLHNKLRHIAIDRKESMSEYIVARLLLDPELQKNSSTTAGGE